MAKTTAPLISFEARGKVASQQIFQRSKSRNIAKSYASPRNPQSAAQVADRLKLANAVESWRRYQQDPDVRQYWRYFADSRKGNRTGYNDAIAALKDTLVTDTIPALPVGPAVKRGSVLEIPMANMLTGASEAEAKPYTVRLGVSKDAMLTVSVGGPTGGNLYAPTTPGPQYTTGMLAWWDASQVWDIDGADRVVQLLDSSGQEHTMLPDTIATSPTLVTSAMNGRKALRFNGTDQRMRTPKFLQDRNELDIFYVLDRIDTGTYQWLLSQRKSAGASVECYIEGWYDVDNITFGAFYSAPAVWKQYISTDATDYAPHLFRIRARLADLHWYLDGVDRFNVAPWGPIVANANITKLNLGAPHEDVNVQLLKGDLGEILIYDHALTDDDALTVTRYLMNKYAIGTPTWTDRQWKFLQLMLYGKPRSGIIPIP